MIDQSSLEIIRKNPIGKGLDSFHASFNLTLDSLDGLGHDGNIVV
jgi:hypothetical protein